MEFSNYEGEDLRGWILKAEKYFQYYQTYEECKVDMASMQEFAKRAAHVQNWPEHCLLGVFLSGLKEDLYVDVRINKTRSVYKTVSLALEYEGKQGPNRSSKAPTLPSVSRPPLGEAVQTACYLINKSPSVLDVVFRESEVGTADDMPEKDKNESRTDDVVEQWEQPGEVIEQGEQLDDGVKYLRGTVGYCLCFGGSDPILKGFADADMAEYIGATESGKDMVWLKRFLQELELHQKEYVVYCDIQSAIDLSKNSMYHARTKHIDVGYHWICEQVENESLQVQKIHTSENPADMLTKVVPRDRLPDNDNEARIEEPEIRAEVPLDINSQIALEANQRFEPKRSVQGGARSIARDTYSTGEIG
uniref:Retrovirus-related Pol polyprotein from transposon TNT 1-94 n=1 Tax=Nicotiana tabacum TaxID=4097 RepID=A0A1S3XZ44_TOBAC